MDVDFPVLGNELDDDGKFHAVHGDFGLDKGRPINWLVNHGHVVIGFAGDSAGDIEGAEAVRSLGSTVVVIGKGTEALNRLACYRFEDYRQLMPLLPTIIRKAERIFAGF